MKLFLQSAITLTLENLWSGVFFFFSAAPWSPKTAAPLHLFQMQPWCIMNAWRATEELNSPLDLFVGKFLHVQSLPIVAFTPLRVGGSGLRLRWISNAADSHPDEWLGTFTVSCKCGTKIAVFLGLCSEHILQMFLHSKSMWIAGSNNSLSKDVQLLLIRKRRVYTFSEV